MHLARLGFHYGFDVLRPMPPRLEGGEADRGVSQLDQVDPCLLDVPYLVRVIEPLPTELHNPILRDAFNRSRR
jgi:hypothetical protein